MTDSYGHGGADHSGSEAADGVAGSVYGGYGCGKEANVELATQCIEDSTYQQGAEKTLRHGAQCVNAVAAAGNDYVFADEECLESCEKLFHKDHTPCK